MMRVSDIARTALGGALVLVPGSVLRLAATVDPDAAETAIARLLGARYLLQVVVVATVRRTWAKKVGTVVELLHGASMLLLALRSPGRRRPACLSAATAITLAAADSRPARRRVMTR